MGLEITASANENKKENPFKGYNLLILKVKLTCSVQSKLLGSAHLADLLEEDLGTWRRTHYSVDINPTLNESEIIIMGWVSSIRDHGNIKFLTINDRFGHIQIALKKKDCSNAVLEKTEQIREHTSIAIKGKVKSEIKAPNGAEVLPIEIKILSLARKASPFLIQSRKSVGIDTRLDLRALDLRRPFLQSLFNIRNAVIDSCREFLRKDGFMEVNTPKIIATATEGGASPLSDILL